MMRGPGKTSPSKVHAAAPQRATPRSNRTEGSKEVADSGRSETCFHEKDEDLVLSVALNPCEAVPDLDVEHTDASSVHVSWSFRRGHLEPPAAGWEVELWAYDF